MKSQQRISRRQMLELGAAATLGAIVNTLDQASIDAAIAVNSTNVTLSGFAAEYDRYDGLGLASLVAKKQITPTELLNAHSCVVLRLVRTEADARTSATWTNSIRRVEWLLAPSRAYDFSSRQRGAA